MEMWLRTYHLDSRALHGRRRPLLPELWRWCLLSGRCGAFNSIRRFMRRNTDLLFFRTSFCVLRGARRIGIRATLPTRFERKRFTLLVIGMPSLGLVAAWTRLRSLHSWRRLSVTACVQ